MAAHRMSQWGVDTFGRVTEHMRLVWGDGLQAHCAGQGPGDGRDCHQPARGVDPRAGSHAAGQTPGVGRGRDELDEQSSKSRERTWLISL